MHTDIPVVLLFSGNDPSGGAGIQADIETLASHGCHAAPVITALTIQNTIDIKKLIPVSADTVKQQAETILSDMPVSAIKIGLLGNAEVAQTIADIIQQHPDIPVIFDPVCSTGGGTSVADKTLLNMMNSVIIPATHIMTPNTLEARLLTQQEALNDCGLTLLNKGCDFVLITGTHDHDKHPQVDNRLYHEAKLMETFSWERLTGEYHGSGCTLASSIAALIARGLTPFSAIHEAQEYTWETLQNSYSVGKGQALPNRFFWVET